MNKTPLFSILVANYNNGNFIEDCFKSILKQTYNNWEIVIVDDASTDLSNKIYEKFKDDQRFRFFKNGNNKGCGYTKRKCIELAKGVICGFLDPDDIIIETSIKRMVEEHLKHPMASMIYSNYYLCNESLEIIKKSSNEAHDNKKFIVGKMPNPFTTFKKEFYKTTQGINEKYKRAIDRDLVLKLEEVGDVIKIEDYLYYYRINPNSISMDSNRFKSSYWTWQARFDACERRNIDKESMFEMVSLALLPDQKDNPLKRTLDYRVGHFILYPFRLIQQIIMKNIK
jgi:glycosyltransferase involved in cell wall biosynthesis